MLTGMICIYNLLINYNHIYSISIVESYYLLNTPMYFGDLMEASLQRLFSAENGGGAESSSFLSWFDLSGDQPLSRSPPRITSLE